MVNKASRCKQQSRWVSPIHTIFCCIVLWLEVHTGTQCKIIIFFYFDSVKKGDIQPVYSDKKEKKIDKEKQC